MTREYRFYRGGSMKGTFRPGDCVIFRPLGTHPPVPGDVVLFRSRSGGGTDAVHRVVSVGTDGLTVRGDDNLPSEVEVVPPEDVLGLVTAVERNGRRLPVAGGVAGGIWAGLVSRGGLPRRLLSALYGLVRRSRVLRLFWRPGVEVLRVGTDPEGVLRLVCSGRTVGRWCPERGILLLRKPWDLVLDSGDCPDQPPAPAEREYISL